MSYVLWSILPNLIGLIWPSLSITSDSVASIGNTSANSKWRGAREATYVSISNHRVSTRSIGVCLNNKGL
jgi:hypothetical protein